MNNIRNFKYVFFQYSDYNRAALRDLNNLSNVTLLEYDGFSFIVRFLIKCINSRKLIHIRVFLIDIFLNYIYDFSFSTNEHIVFVIYEQHFFSRNLDFFKHIKKKYKNSRIVYMLTNSISSNVNSVQLKMIKNNPTLFDKIITFNNIDAIRYNFEYFDQVFSKFQNEDTTSIHLSFCGLDKGRKSLLNAIKNKLNTLSISYEIKCIESISELVSYSELIKLTLKSNCLLEVIVDPNQTGSTLRAVEAIANNKKLLTNNKSILEKGYYNSKQIMYFESVEDIDPTFVTTQLLENETIDRSLVSPVNLITFISGILSN